MEGYCTDCLDCLPLPSTRKVGNFLSFGSCPIFCADKTPKILFLGLSLLPNPTETLATQAIFYFLKSIFNCWYMIALDCFVMRLVLNVYIFMNDFFVYPKFNSS